jgi:rhamnosyltransferase
MNRLNITAIIVTYIPDTQVIVDTIESIYAQVGNLLIIDNTPGGSDIFRDGKLLSGKNNIELITINKNVGIAQAQNIGIQRALEGGAEFVLLSDQDTHYPNDYIANMLRKYSVFAKEKKLRQLFLPILNEIEEGGMGL